MARAQLKFSEILLRRNILSQEQLMEAETTAAQRGMSLAEALLATSYVSPEELGEAMAEQHGLKFVELSHRTIPEALAERMPESVARENNVVPIEEDADEGRLVIAISNPEAFDTVEKVQFILNRPVETVLALKEQIQAAINKLYGQKEEQSVDSILTDATETVIDFTSVETETKAGEESGEDANAAPIVRLVHYIISEAVQLRASDIHIEPFEDRIRVRYRIDGALVERDNIPKRMLGAVLSRIKILSTLDIAERRRTQDGRIKITAGGKELDLRVSVIPTNHGQSVVMRLLDKDNIRIGLRQLGFADEDYIKFKNLVRRPNGIILVTGPTGSGKTTSLYAALNDLNTPDRKIITAEDPVEYYLPGINQVEIKHDIGLDFARVIRAMLRQAPNVILIGEMRDLETAQAGIQASLTGHLVFSTLHTNDAPSAITRLVDMKVPSYLVASSVVAIMAQRLVRVNCPKCRMPVKLSDSVLEQAGFPPQWVDKAKFMRGRGCPHCHGSGYRGRLAIFELMLMSAKIREMTFKELPANEIRRVAVSEGMKTLYMDGLVKVAKGFTTIEELTRVARMDEGD